MEAEFDIESGIAAQAPSQRFLAGARFLRFMLTETPRLVAF
jgi:hypothetical protein